ncbi:hypothetical protein [Streptomyces sp. NPDC046909]|uniref:hypothetical protein n=1 Tax=Streptomyces sp. NPDC046909 TaxID=3155617 RepID=UPI0033E8EFD6
MEHAYGSAEEVPTLLTALRSPDAGIRREALDRFYGAVHHQGSVFPPTAAAFSSCSSGSRTRPRLTGLPWSRCWPASARSPGLAAVAGLGLFVDDAGFAVAVLRERLGAEHGITVRLRIVEAAAMLALKSS